MVQVILVVAAAAVAGVLAWLLTRFALKARYARELTDARAALETEKALRANESAVAAERLEDARKDYERSLAEMKETQADRKSVV